MGHPMDIDAKQTLLVIVWVIAAMVAGGLVVAMFQW
jgi:hypothetical protein